MKANSKYTHWVGWLGESPDAHLLEHLTILLTPSKTKGNEAENSERMKKELITAWLSSDGK